MRAKTERKKPIRVSTQAVAELSPRALRAYIMIANNRGKIEPQKLNKHWSEATLYRALAELRAKGYIKATKRETTVTLAVQ